MSDDASILLLRHFQSRKDIEPTIDHQPYFSVNRVCNTAASVPNLISDKCMYDELSLKGCLAERVPNHVRRFCAW
jgi:hypothetical protein